MNGVNVPNKKSWLWLGRIQIFLNLDDMGCQVNKSTPFEVSWKMHKEAKLDDFFEERKARKPANNNHKPDLG